MASSDQTGWRLRVIIFITCILLAVYIVNGIFVVGGDINMVNPNKVPYGANETMYTTNSIDMFLRAMTFTYIDNFLLLLIINSFMLLLWMVYGILIYTFIRDWIPFV